MCARAHVRVPAADALMARGTCYLRLTAEWEGYSLPGHERRLTGFHVEAVTKNPPQAATPGVVVKLVLDVPDQAFLPLRPEAVVAVSMGELMVNVAVAEPDQPEEP